MPNQKAVLGLLLCFVAAAVMQVTTGDGSRICSFCYELSHSLLLLN